MVVMVNELNRNTIIWVLLHGDVVLVVLPMTHCSWDMGSVVRESSSVRQISSKLYNDSLFNIYCTSKLAWSTLMMLRNSVWDYLGSCFGVLVLIFCSPWPVNIVCMTDDTSKWGVDFSFMGVISVHCDGFNVHSCSLYSGVELGSINAHCFFLGGVLFGVACIYSAWAHSLCFPPWIHLHVSIDPMVLYPFFGVYWLVESLPWVPYLYVGIYLPFSSPVSS